MNSDSVFRDGACQHVGTDRLMSTRTWASSFDLQGAKPHVTLMPLAPWGWGGRCLVLFFILFSTFITCLYFRVLF